jgi:hypothetical protein
MAKIFILILIVLTNLLRDIIKKKKSMTKASLILPIQKNWVFRL